MNDRLRAKRNWECGDNMNMIFWILVIVALVCVWFCMNGIFRGIGRFLSAVMQETRNALDEESEDVN